MGACPVQFPTTADKMNHFCISETRILDCHWLVDLFCTESEAWRNCFRNSRWIGCVVNACNPRTVRKRQKMLRASLVYTVSRKPVEQTKILSQNNKEESGEQEAFGDGVSHACSQDSEQTRSLAVLSCLVWQHPLPYKPKCQQKMCPTLLGWLWHSGWRASGSSEVSTDAFISQLCPDSLWPLMPLRNSACFKS